MRHLWMAVLLIGIVFSFVLYTTLINAQQQALQSEINHRSTLRLTTIRTLILQHMDIAMVMPAFIDAQMVVHEYIEKIEAKRFMRGVLRVHPSEMLAMAIFPAEGHGDTVRITQPNQSVVALNPPVDIIQFIDMLPSTQKIVLVRDNIGQYRLRILSMSHEKPHSHAVVDLDITQLLLAALSKTQMVGLDMDIVGSIAGDEVLLLHHRAHSQNEQDANDEDKKEGLHWQDMFNAGGQDFIIRTKLAPAMAQEFITWHSLLGFVFVLFISMILALIIYRLSRYQDDLEEAVDARTSELADEKVKLGAVIDSAKESILLVDMQGSILQANPSASTLFGYTAEEWKGVSVHDLVPSMMLHASHAQVFDQEKAGEDHHIMGKVRELQAQRRGGEVFPCELTTNIFEVRNKRQFSVILRDMTEYKQRAWIRDVLLKIRAHTQTDRPLQVRLKSILKELQSEHDAWPFAATSAAIFITQGDELWLTASIGWCYKDKKHWLVVPFDECLCGKGMESCKLCERVLTSRASRNACFVLARGENKSATLCMPIMHDDVLLGLIHINLGTFFLTKEIRGFYAQVRDILAEVIWNEHTRKSLESSEEKHRLLVESIPIGIVILVQGIVRFTNLPMASLLGLEDPTALLDENILDYISVDTQPQFMKRMLHLQRGEAVNEMEGQMEKEDGLKFWIVMHGSAIIYEGNPAVRMLVQNISARKDAEKKLTWLSYYDGLTSLPNRRLFRDRLNQAIALARREDRCIALFYMDLDRFKFINDTLGHPTGDLVLKETAERLNQILRTSDTAARMGGDEFVVLLPKISATTAMFVAKKVRAEIFQRPYQLGKQKFALDVSIGIAIFPNDGKDGETLLRHADMAMYHAKQQQLHIHQFSSEMEQRVSRHLYMEQELAKAIANNQLELYYQSQVCHGKIIGVESLIRWKHPTFGLVPHAEFIPLAEETNLIHAITYWVLTEAASQAVLWEKEGIRPTRIGVNLSAAQLIEKGLAEKIIQRIHSAGAKPEWMEIELTESAIMRDPKIAITVMQELVDAGISVAIDDFGTGYSSLAYLKQLPAEWLKIDISFIRYLPDNKEDVSIVRSIIAMANALGIKTIAEGVETAAQFEFLCREGCPTMQGYLFSKPLPKDDASQLLRQEAS
ncbi:MAG: EAL domain-containing protein [Mariprofundaceae bacterium]|nr:EAL domain-containing protein [Mariprofundaceae bacterium]